MSGTPLMAGGSPYPQGLEFAQIAQQVAAEAAQVLPGLISGLLAAHPQIPQQSLQFASTAPPSTALQGYAQAGLGWPSPIQQGPIGFSRQLAFEPGMQTMQGYFGYQGDPGLIAQHVATAAAQALPSVISGLLWSHIQRRQQAAQWASAWPQAYNIPWGGAYGLNPMLQQNLGQIVHQALAQQLRQPTLQFGGPFAQAFPVQSGFGYGFNPLQQLDIPQLVQHAVAQQLRQQTAQFGIPAFQGYGTTWLNPQQSEITQLTHQISGVVAQQIPGLVSGAMSAMPGPRF